ncbi:MAG TPA: hypothetical protein VF760_03175, partial [Xanthobacteraceae bacterium]
PTPVAALDRTISKGETLLSPPTQRIYHVKRVKRRPKPMTAVNRQSLVSRKKSRIYLHCGEAITHAAEALKLRWAGQFCDTL